MSIRLRIISEQDGYGPIGYERDEPMLGVAELLIRRGIAVEVTPADMAKPEADPERPVAKAIGQPKRDKMMRRAEVQTK